MRETLFNLKFDWQGELEWRGVYSEKDRRDIIKMIAIEVDRIKKRSFFERLFNLEPK